MATGAFWRRRWQSFLPTCSVPAFHLRHHCLLPPHLRYLWGRSLAFLVKVSFRWGDIHHQSAPSPSSTAISPVKVPGIKRDLHHLPPTPPRPRLPTRATFPFLSPTSSGVSRGARPSPNQCVHPPSLRAWGEVSIGMRLRRKFPAEGTICRHGKRDQHAPDASRAPLTVPTGAPTTFASVPHGSHREPPLPIDIFQIP